MTSQERQFGNTLQSLKPFFATMLVFGLVVAAIFLFAATKALQDFGGNLAERAAMAIGYAALVVAVPVVAVLPTCLFEIAIDQTHIEHRLLGRFVISRKAFSELQKIEIGTGWGAVLHFADRSKIRFYGAHLGVLGEMRDYFEGMMHRSRGA